MKQFAESIGTTRQCIWLVVHGHVRSKKYRSAIADFVGKPVSEIWPEQAAKEGKKTHPLDVVRAM